MDWRSPEIYQLYHDILRDLNGTPGMQGSALITVDGVVIAAELSKSFSAEQIDLLLASLASITALGINLVQDTRKGVLDQIYVKVEHGYIIILPVFADALLIALCREDTKLGLVFLDMGIARHQLLSASPEGIIIPRPPKSLNTDAEPEY